MTSSTVAGLTRGSQPLTGAELLYGVQGGSDRKVSAFDIASAGVLDPLAAYNAAGVRTTTTGTITSGQASLVVASASGWSVGMGIAVANAGSGGNTELITTVSAINGTTFTLAASASATATAQTVNHDDTAAIQAAVNATSASLQRLRLRAGNYNVTSQISFTAPIMFLGDGAPENGGTTGGSVIWNRGRTNHVFNISSSSVVVRDIAIEQAAGITPTAGFGINIGHASNPVYYVKIENCLIYGTRGGLALSGNVTGAYIAGNRIKNNGGASNNDGAVNINNPVPAGSNKWIGNGIGPITTGPGVLIINSDVNEWTHNAFSGGDPCLSLSGGTIIAQSFVNCTIESGSNVGPLVVIAAGQGTVFVGGELGQDNVAGGISITGGTGIAIIGVDFNAVTGTPIARSGATGVNVFGNLSTQGTAAITNVVNDVAAVSFTGSPSAGFTVTNGIVTHA